MLGFLRPAYCESDAALEDGLCEGGAFILAFSYLPKRPLSAVLP